jgi:hypothetical protein
MSFKLTKIRNLDRNKNGCYGYRIKNTILNFLTSKDENF